MVKIRIFKENSSFWNKYSKIVLYFTLVICFYNMRHQRSETKMVATSPYVLNVLTQLSGTLQWFCHTITFKTNCIKKNPGRGKVHYDISIDNEEFTSFFKWPFLKIPSPKKKLFCVFFYCPGSILYEDSDRFCCTLIDPFRTFQPPMHKCSQ